MREIRRKRGYRDRKREALSGPFTILIKGLCEKSLALPALIVEMIGRGVPFARYGRVIVVSLMGRVRVRDLGW